MIGYVIRRVLYTIPVLFGVALLIFLLFHSVGEDPVRVALGSHATPAAIAELRAQWGLDKPVALQFVDFLKQIVTFDYGRSYTSGEELGPVFAKGAVISLWVTLPPLLAGIAISIALGLLIAYYRDSWLDRLSTVMFIVAMSISYLVYIIAFQYLLAYKLDWFPINGYESGLAGVRYLVLPWLIIVLVSLGPDTRLFRTIFLDETHADYVRTARAKGVGELRMLFGHVLKNAMIPIVTYTMGALPLLLLGAFLMERYFSIPGIGYLLVDAIHNGDFPVLKGVTMVIAIAYSAMVVLNDIAYALVDPRVSLQ